MSPILVTAVLVVSARGHGGGVPDLEEMEALVAQRVDLLDPLQVIDTYAGDGEPASEGDGGAAASVFAPVDVESDAAGNLFICERDGNRVRVADAGRPRSNPRLDPRSRTGRVNGRALHVSLAAAPATC